MPTKSKSVNNTQNVDRLGPERRTRTAITVGSSRREREGYRSGELQKTNEAAEMALVNRQEAMASKAAHAILFAQNNDIR
jgi:hypothetical protein